MAVAAIHADRSRPSRCAGLDAPANEDSSPSDKAAGGVIITNLGRAAAFCRHRSLNASLSRMSQADPAAPSPIIHLPFLRLAFGRFCPNPNFNAKSDRAFA